MIGKLHEQNKYGHLVGSISSVAKDALPRLGASLDVQPIADIIGVKSADTFVRPMYAGNAIATVKSNDPVKIITVRPTAFAPAAAGSGSNAVESVDVPKSELGIFLIVRLLY